MKIFSLSLVAIFILAMLPLAVAAQTSEMITLNAVTPGIDIVVSPAPNTTGTVALQLSGAGVSVLDNAGNTVFEVADPRVQALELHFAPNSLPHTVTITRLPNVEEAYVMAESKADLTFAANSQAVTSTGLAPGQTFNTLLSATQPNQLLALHIPVDSQGSIVSSFAGLAVTEQWVDAQGQALATLYAGQIDGVSLTLTGGDYQLTLLNGSSNQEVPALIALQAAPSPVLPAATAATIKTTATTTAPIAAVPPAVACTFQVGQMPANLRSGPGEGYSVVALARANQILQVGGSNPEQNWLLVSDGTSSAWVSQAIGTNTGDCTNLTVYNIPLRAAVAPVINIQSNPQGGESEHEENEHEEGEENEDD